LRTLNTHRTLVARAAAVLLGVVAATASSQGTGGGGSSGDSTGGGTPPSSSTPSSATPTPTTEPTPAPSASGNDPGTVGMLPGSVTLNGANPWYFGVSETLTHDTNIFRVPNGTSGNISSTSLNGGIYQPFGRQRLSAAGTVSYNKYFGESSLDNTSYDLRGNFDWETVGHLSGNVGLAFGQTLSAPVIGAGVAPTEQRNQS